MSGIIVLLFAPAVFFTQIPSLIQRSEFARHLRLGLLRAPCSPIHRAKLLESPIKTWYIIVDERSRPILRKINAKRPKKPPHKHHRFAQPARKPNPTQ